MWHPTATAVYKEAQERVERSLVSWVSQCRKMVDSYHREAAEASREGKSERGGHTKVICVIHIVSYHTV